MTSLQRKALWASAEHWLNNWQDPENASTDGDDCPCCQEFYDHAATVDTGCRDCPIYQYTGLPECEGTPYYHAREAKISLGKGFYSFGTEEMSAVDVTREAFEEEYRFLVELALGELV